MLLERVTAVPESEWRTALELLFQSYPADERVQRIDNTLEAVKIGQLSLAGLRQLRVADETAGVSLTMSQPDGITLVWPPEVNWKWPFAAAVRQHLLQELCQRLDHQQARLGQVLLDDDGDDASTEWLRASGFVHEIRLFFLGRDLSQTLPAAGWQGECVTYCDELQARFAAVLEATYVDTLDCPFLEGIRTGAEALATHQGSGRFYPELWQIFTQTDPVSGQVEDVGLCLLNDHPDQQAMELTYFGVVPKFRGRGLGRQLLCAALARAAEWQREALFLSADFGNIYANSVYAELGFVELARRRVFFRPPGGLARQSSTGS